MTTTYRHNHSSQHVEVNGIELPAKRAKDSYEAVDPTTLALLLRQIAYGHTRDSMVRDFLPHEVDYAIHVSHKLAEHYHSIQSA